MNTPSPYTFQLGDAAQLLKTLPDSSVHFVVTDPPYFTDGFSDTWSDTSLKRKASKAKVIGGLPIGMKFDRKQGDQLQSFMQPIAQELHRVLKPGGFCIVFSQARLYHRMAMAFDIAGFEIRDMLAWKYEGQAKAFSQSHFIRRSTSLSEEDKRSLIHELDGWKTPQLKPQLEPMVLAQKKRQGTFVQNWTKHGVGLVNTKESLNGRFPGTVLEFPKYKKSKGIDHLTVKPVEVAEHLIRLFTQEGQTVLDPFMGSGSHALASVLNHRQFIGFDTEAKYLSIAEERIREALQKQSVQTLPVPQSVQLPLPLE